MRIKYPLIGDNWSSDSTTADKFVYMLQKECINMRTSIVSTCQMMGLDVNIANIVGYAILHTEGGESFAVIFKPETRVSKYSRFGNNPIVGKYRFSYNESILGEDSKDIMYALRAHANRMVKRQYTQLQAVTLKDNKLVPIGTMSYIVGTAKGVKSAYVDGVEVYPEYRNRGVANAMQDYLHLRLADEGVYAIHTDTKKRVYDYKGKTPLYDFESVYFNMLTHTYCYDIEDTNTMNNERKDTVPLKVFTKNIPLNKSVVLSEDELAQHYKLDTNVKE